MSLKPGVSVVVCCYNSADIIGPTLKALSEQAVPNTVGYEVVLVDNNCTDTTVATALEAWGRAPYPLRVLKEKESGLIHARKTGTGKAQYEIVLFVDDDNILDPNWVSGSWNLFKGLPRVAAIGGLNEPFFEGEKPAWFDSFAVVYACKPQNNEPGLLTSRKTLFGAGLAFRSCVLRSIFDSGPPLFLVGRKKDVMSRGEDSEICLRAALLGWDLWYESTLTLRHRLSKTRLSWDYVKATRRGGGAADAILMIYKYLLEGRPPLKYKEFIVYLSKIWEDFWKNLKDASEIQRVGSACSFHHSYLQGLTKALRNFSEDEYDTVRGKIIEFFAAQK